MKQHNCEKCPMRARYDKSPKSLLGKIWRWHINFCPGWKSYLQSLGEEDREVVKKTYQFVERKAL